MSSLLTILVVNFQYGTYCNTYYQSIVIAEYPIEIPLTNEEKVKCKNEILKERGKFYVQKKQNPITDDDDPIRYTFTAVLERDDDTALSTLIAIEGGECNYVRTGKVYRGCSLAKYLMVTCFQDESIIGENERGFNVMEKIRTAKNFGWKKSPMRIDASVYCKTMIYLVCASDPRRNCISYLRAAAFANFDLLFSFGKDMKAFKIDERLESEFGQKSDEFIENNGQFWYFCKCQEGSKFACLAMASNEP